MPSKNEELAILDGCIEELGTSSYLGGWLATLRSRVEQNIRNDFLPPTLSRLDEEAKDILEEAKQAAETMIDKANLQAVGILDAARRKAEASRKQIIAELERVRQMFV
jgi:cell division septum initiation protein DivIVA